MNDGQTCKAGNAYNYNNSYDFPADKQIVKVEVILTNYSSYIGKIIFYSKDGVLRQLGDVPSATGPKETFLIGDNERLIGCELETGKYNGKDYLIGVTFLKWTIA